MAQNEGEMPRRQITGDALDWTDEDIERLATVTPMDIADSRADARRDPLLWALLTASEVDNTSGE